MKKILYLSILAISLTSCSGIRSNITKRLPPLDDSTEVMVFDTRDTVPENAEVLGGLFTTLPSQNWETKLENIKSTVRAAGGNGLEIQMHAYPNKEEKTGHVISAFILNINDSIEPVPPVAFAPMVFHDYVVMLNGDTIPCFIADEKDNSILFVHGYNTQGYRKSISLPKSELISYHIEDPEALALTQYNKNKKLFTTQIAIDGGYTAGATFAFAANVRFSRKKTVDPPEYSYSTIGLHYDHSSNQTHFIAGSIGILGYPSNPDQIMDFYLDGACNFPKISKKRTMYLDFLLGYVNYEDTKWGQWGPQLVNRHAIGIGFNEGFDFMISDHFYWGFQWYGYIGIPLEKGASGCSALNISAGLRYYL